VKVSRLLPPALTLATLAACGGGSTAGPSPTVSCAAPAVITLAVGQSVILDPTASGGCIQIPDPAGTATAHLVVAVATNGQETSNGISTSYSLSGGQPVAAAPAPLQVPPVGGFRKPGTAEAFHLHLRQMERGLAEAMGTEVLPLAPPIVKVPPVLGSTRSFNVCANTSCTSFVSVTATAKYVGSDAAIYLDNAAPSGGYTQSDIDAAGALFENPVYGLHVIDTTAFGSESDLDGNGVVVILLTPKVNALSGSCTNSVIAGFFFGGDLTSQAGSNHGEIFYSMVPDPSSATCPIGKAFASQLLPVTFIHEFQHMISFNQHVLVRNCGCTEDIWLNEGLSHFAEELGGRQIDNSVCTNASCLDQYVRGDLQNAYDYLSDPEGNYLVEPETSTGTLAERGANWLFVRWMVDQFAADSVLGTAFTRQLVGTADFGVTNVENRTATAFSILVPQWQIANFTEGDTTFVQTAATSRFRYKTWNLRRIFTLNPTVFPEPYPLVPPVMTSTFGRSGTLLAGSGPHLIVLRAANDTAANLRLTTGNAAAQARLGVVRLQ
jgi:hypothetical protein